MQTTARQALVNLVFDHLKLLVQDAVSVSRASKRGRIGESDPNRKVRRRIHASDVNLALELQGSEKLYATASRSSTDNASATRPVNLAAFLQEESSQASLDQIPREPSFQLQWLAVDGVPTEESRPVMSMKEKPSKETNSSHSQLDNGDTLAVEQLQASMLSGDLQLYLQRVTLALSEKNNSSPDSPEQDAILRSLAQDSGLQEIIPFVVRHAVQGIYNSAERDSVLQVRIILALLQNKHVHCELVLHQIAPALITAVISESSTTTTKWTAAAGLARVIGTFRNDYPTLSSRILQAYVKGLSLSSPKAVEGGLIGLATLPSVAVQAWALPLVASGFKDEWTPACQQAALSCVSVALRNGENDISLDSMGDSVVAYQSQVATDYHACIL